MFVRNALPPQGSALEVFRTQKHVSRSETSVDLDKHMQNKLTEYNMHKNQQDAQNSCD